MALFLMFLKNFSLRENSVLQLMESIETWIVFLAHCYLSNSLRILVKTLKIDFPYADDTTLFARISNPNDRFSVARSLNRDLAKFNHGSKSGG